MSWCSKGTTLPPCPGCKRLYWMKVSDLKGSTGVSLGCDSLFCYCFFKSSHGEALTFCHFLKLLESWVFLLEHDSTVHIVFYLSSINKLEAYLKMYNLNGCFKHWRHVCSLFAVCLITFCLAEEIKSVQNWLQKIVSYFFSWQKLGFMFSAWFPQDNYSKVLR